MSRAAERLIDHRRLILAAWIMIAALAAVFAGRIGQVLQGGADAIPGSDSDHVTRTLERTFGRGSLYQFLVVFRDSTATTDDPEYAGAVERVTRAVAAMPGVRTIETHRERIMRKLNIHSIAGLTKFAIAKGLLPLGK